MANVIVTGGAGMIGSHLVDRLIELGHHVIVIDNLSTGLLSNINYKANFIEMDINDDFLWRDADFTLFSGIDVIFHLAAQINLRNSFVDPIHDANTNILGSLKIIELAQRYSAKLIFASTGGAIYSPNAELPWDEDSLAEPLSPYGISKLTIENYLKVLNINHAILRLANVYGPRQNSKGEAGVISIFIDNILNNKDLVIFGNGLQTRDFIYVDDVIDAFIIAMEKDLSGIFNISTCKGTEILQLAELIKDKMNYNNEIQFVNSIAGELKHSCLRNNIFNYYGRWKPKTTLSDGIDKTIEYFRDIYKAV